MLKPITHASEHGTMRTLMRPIRQADNFSPPTRHVTTCGSLWARNTGAAFGRAARVTPDDLDLSYLPLPEPYTEAPSILFWPEATDPKDESPLFASNLQALESTTMPIPTICLDSLPHLTSLHHSTNLITP